MGAEVVLGDLLESDLAALCAGVDTVFHAAALSSPWGPERRFQRINVEATKGLLDAARGAGVKRFVFVSSPSVYAALRDRPNLTEADPPAAHPLNAYARTKLAAERLVLAANTAKFRTTAVRPRGLIGPDDQVFLPRILRVVERGRFPLFRGGRALVELTDVRDAARAIVLADERIDRVGGGPVNIAGGRPVAIRDLALKLGEALNRPLRFKPIPMALARPLASLSETISAALPGSPEPVLTPYTLATLAYTQTFDLKHAREALGFTPQFDAVAEALALAPGMVARVESMTRCRLHILKAGACFHPAASTRVGASLCPAEYPALAGLILHPSEGAILFDTGYDPAFFAATRGFPERLYRWTAPVELPAGGAAADQLARFGLKPQDVRAVVVSHFHGDHVAGLHAFPDAQLYCARAGLEQVKQSGRLARVRRGVLSALVPEALATRPRFFEDLPRVALGGEPAALRERRGPVRRRVAGGGRTARPLPWSLGPDPKGRERPGRVSGRRRGLVAGRDPRRRTAAQVHHRALGPHRRPTARRSPRCTRSGRATRTLKLTPSHCPEAAAEAEAERDVA